MRAYVSVHKLSGASFHKVVASKHMSTRATTGARVQVTLSPLSDSGNDRPSRSPWATVDNAVDSLKKG